MKRFITTSDFDSGLVRRLVDDALEGKRTRWRNHADALRGKVVGLLFLAPSLRTRTSFQSGVARLGGTTIVLNGGQESYPIEYGEGAVMNGGTVEHVKDATRALSRYLDALCVRSLAHPPPGARWETEREDSVIHAYSRYATVPFINMESSMWHPCQALADAMTIKERHPDPKRKKFVLSWADHPRALATAVPNSALVVAAQLGMDVTLACPEGYELDSDVVRFASEECGKNGASFMVESSQRRAFDGADVVYAKSWSPPRLVGKAEEDFEERRRFGSWMVTSDLMKLTNSATFLHCLPVRRNVEIADDVLDAPSAAVFDEAENRMHAQNALLLELLCRAN